MDAERGAETPWMRQSFDVEGQSANLPLLRGAVRCAANDLSSRRYSSHIL